MMKNLIYLFISLFVIFSCKNEPGYVIQGNIAGASGLNVYLSKRVGKNFVIVDSTIVENDQFKLTGNVNFPELYYFEIEDQNGRLDFFLENSEIEITGQVDSLGLIKVIGSSVNDEYIAYKKLLEPYHKKMNDLEKPYYDAQAKNDTALMSKIYNDYMDISKELKAFEIEFIKTHGSSYIVPPLIRSATVNMDYTEIEDLIKDVSDEVLNTPIMIKIKGRIEALKSTATGMPAPNFISKNIEGQEVKFSDLPKGKLLLLDFWAAWCSPCRRENPNIVHVYNEFHQKGFNVLGISLDKSEKDWINAIKTDKLQWIQWSDLNYWDCDGVTKYGIVAIPTNFLIDENGIIIAKNIKGDDLYHKVKEILE